MKYPIRQIITTNPLLKLASLALAIALWFFVVSKGSLGIIMDVPVGFKNLPSGLELVEVTKAVSINIEGQERILKSLKQENINVLIDLKNAKKGELFFSVSPENVSLPKNLVITKISPQTVRLVLEEKLRKNVIVSPLIISSPATGYILGKIEVIPKSVEIEGPLTAVTKVYSLKTEPIDISGITADSQYTVNLNITQKNVRVNPPEVKVNIFVRRVK
ncbi:MAG: hypothetical protein HY752_08950 [Nitrospirae bacterium]|nr:hypothetical protein [Nitrospirota bacterium]